MFKNAVPRVITYNDIYQGRDWVIKQPEGLKARVSKSQGWRHRENLDEKKPKRGEEQLVDMQFCMYANLCTGADGRGGILNKEIQEFSIEK